MHELSVCRAIATTVTEHASGREVARVEVRIGHLRQVVPDTLAYCWGVVTDGTDLAGCRLEITYVPAVGRCRACDAETELTRPVLVCGQCGGREMTLVSGEEFLVASIDVLEAI